MITTSIVEIEGLSFIDAVSEEYRDKTGVVPFNLSHWDPSDQTIATLFKDLRLPSPPLAAPYLHPHYLDLQQQVLQRFGFPSKKLKCLLVQSGTNALLFATWWLKALKIKRVVAICPVYFSFFYACELIGLECSRLYMRRESKKWYLPQSEILKYVCDAPSETALWITNPIFGTGNYLSSLDINFIASLLDAGVTIAADECLALNGHELGSIFAESERFLGFYTPHKTVGINAVKFAAIVFHSIYEKFFDHWTDILAGGLGASSYTAIMHFLGSNFLHFQSAFLEYTSMQHRIVLEAISRYRGAIEADEDCKGYFITCYAPGLTVNSHDINPFLRGLVFHTGAVLIPGVRNHIDPQIGFNFRINLARGCPQFHSAFCRTLDYLAKMSIDAMT